MSQVTYRVIQVSDGQLEGQTDGAAAVSLVAGFPATSQTVAQVECGVSPVPGGHVRAGRVESLKCSSGRGSCSSTNIPRG